MPYRVNKRKKVVEVNGDIDLSTIWRKVQAAGGPEGWTLSTFITRDDVHQIASMIALGEDEDDAAEGSDLPYRPIGFRRAGEHQVFAENNLLKPIDDEEEDEVP